MTNHKANPPGWTDLDPTDGEFTAKQFNTIDRGMAGAIDSRGGVYSPAQLLQIDDLGTDNLLDSHMRGDLTRTASGRHRPRIDYATITDSGSTQYVDTTYDIWWSDDAHTQTWNIHLVTTAGNGQVPERDDEIAVSITTDGNQVNIYQESPLVLLASFPAARGVQPSNTPFYAKFWYSGTAWEIADVSSDVF